MNLDTIGEILWWSIFTTPLISWLSVHKQKISEKRKWMLAVIITFILSFVLFIASISILLRDGLGPT